MTWLATRLVEMSSAHTKSGSLLGRLIRCYEGAERSAMEYQELERSLHNLKEIVRLLWLFNRSSRLQKKGIILILEAYEQQRSQ